MKTTATFDAIYGLIVRRNSLIEDRGHVRRKLRGTLDATSRKNYEIEFWHIVGRIDGIGTALEALREAGEHVGSAEYLVIEEAQIARRAANAQIERVAASTD